MIDENKVEIPHQSEVKFIPSISNDEFDYQWSVMKKIFQDNHLNMGMILEIVSAITTLVDKSGYGNIQITFIGGLLQEVKINQVKRVSHFVYQDTDKK